MADPSGPTYNSEVLSTGLFHSVTKITIYHQDNSTDNLDINITNQLSLSRWEAVLLITGAILLGGFFTYILYRLCHISFRRVLNKRKGRRGASPQEEAVNQILSNSGARQVLSSLARTAINSQINRRARDFSSQMSMNAAGEVMDISERVVRVSFAPSVCTRDNSEDEDETSLGRESIGPPPYDTLSSIPPTYIDSPPTYSEVGSDGPENSDEADRRPSIDSGRSNKNLTIVDDSSSSEKKDDL